MKETHIREGYTLRINILTQLANHNWQKPDIQTHVSLFFTIGGQLLFF